MPSSRTWPHTRRCVRSYGGRWGDDIPAKEHAVFGDVSRHFRPGAPVRKWHYDKGRYTYGCTSRPQSPTTRVLFGSHVTCTFSAKSIIQVHIEPKSWLVSRRSAVLTKIFPFSKEESNGKYNHCWFGRISPACKKVIAFRTCLQYVVSAKQTSTLPRSTERK